MYDGQPKKLFQVKIDIRQECLFIAFPFLLVIDWASRCQEIHETISELLLSSLNESRNDSIIARYTSSYLISI